MFKLRQVRFLKTQVQFDKLKSVSPKGSFLDVIQQGCLILQVLIDFLIELMN